jgi:hypothetical protein
MKRKAEDRHVAKSSPAKRKSPPARRAVSRRSQSGKIVGIIDEADARKFTKANNALMKEMRRSKKVAVEILKASGYLDASGRVSKRYR